MATDKCEHKYYEIVEGQLRCSECGAGPEAQKIQDKAKKPSSNKARPRGKQK